MGIGNSSLRKATQHSKWEEVLRLLEDSSPLSDEDKKITDEERSAAVDAFIDRANNSDSFDFSEIIPHCNTEQLEKVLVRATKSGWWFSVGKVLEKGVCDARLTAQAVEEASRRAHEKTFLSDILPYIAGDDLDAALPNLVSRDLWKAVLPCCRDDQLKTLLTHLQNQGLWKDDSDFINILHHFKNHQMKAVLTYLVTHGMWKTVGKVLQVNDTKILSDTMTPTVSSTCTEHLQKSISESQHKWAMEEGSKAASELDFALYVLPHCTKDELDAVLKHLVNRGAWLSVDCVLLNGVSDRQHTRAMEEGSKAASELDFRGYVLPHCTKDELAIVLIHLVNRGAWRSVDCVLLKGVSDRQHTWAMEEGGKAASELDFELYVLPHCTKDELDTVLIHLVKRGVWHAVECVLQKGVSDRQHTWAMEEGSKAASKWDFERCLLPHCRKDELDTVLIHLVNRGEWRSVDCVLLKGVSDRQHKWAVEEGGKAASDWEFERYLLPHCRKDELDTVLIHLVNRGAWRAVDCVLQKGVSDKQHQWAVEQASEKATEGDFMDYIMYHCPNSSIDTVFTKLVDRGFWKSVDKMLTDESRDTHDLYLSYDQLPRFSVCKTKISWAVDQASRRASKMDFEWYMLRHCREDQLEAVLTNLEMRGLPSIVDKNEVNLSWRSHNPYSRLPSYESQFKDDYFFHTTGLLTYFQNSEVDRISISYKIAKRSKPFTLTSNGQSALMYAVRNNHSSKKMVAECTRLGFSTYQPEISGHHRHLIREIMEEFYENIPFYGVRSGHRQSHRIKSPFLFAVIRGEHVVAHMLYESGSCSYEELFYLYTHLPDVTDPLTEEGRQLQRQISHQEYQDVIQKVETFLPYLKEMATTPRSLKSTCRLVIAHSLNTFRGRRYRNVQTLPLPQQVKDYVMFSDITDPSYSPYG